MRGALDSYGLPMPQFRKIGGILASEIGVDEAALHAAIIAVNATLDEEEEDGAPDRCEVHQDTKNILERMRGADILRMVLTRFIVRIVKYDFFERNVPLDFGLVSNCRRFVFPLQTFGKSISFAGASRL